LLRIGQAPVDSGPRDRQKTAGHATDGLRSKSWVEFEAPDAPLFDLVITVREPAAGEACPRWQGSPTRAHWGIPDPAAVTGDSKAVSVAFDLAYERLATKIKASLRKPFDSMGDRDIQAALATIGRDSE
jgi:protein-tyrosine-phosphatase